MELGKGQKNVCCCDVMRCVFTQINKLDGDAPFMYEYWLLIYSSPINVMNILSKTQIESLRMGIYISQSFPTFVVLDVSRKV